MSVLATLNSRLRSLDPRWQVLCFARDPRRRGGSHPESASPSKLSTTHAASPLLCTRGPPAGLHLVVVMLSQDETDEARERRGAECDFVRSAYGESEARIDVPAAGGGSCCCLVTRALSLPVGGDGSAGDGVVVRIELRLGMPPDYPVREGSGLRVSADLVSSPSNPAFLRRAALRAVQDLAARCRSAAHEIAESGGGEAVWTVLAAADEWITSDWEKTLGEYREVAERNDSCHGEMSESAESHVDLTLGRRIIYSHHIIANSKRRGLQELASQYSLGGYAKIGWPGVILVEGEESNCQQFVDEIKRWRWQQLQVRGEEQVRISHGDSLEAHRKLSSDFEELGEDEMSKLAQNCRAAGLEGLFLTCMKINDSRSKSDAEEELETSHYGALVNVDHMNNAKSYRKWLKKTCQSQGCTLIIRQYHSNSNEQSKPRIYVAILGERENVKTVMKQWRTSRVDVDSRNKPCLERMMKVIDEGDVVRIPRDVSNDDDDINCSSEKLQKVLESIDESWALAIDATIVHPK